MAYASCEQSRVPGCSLSSCIGFSSCEDFRWSIYGIPWNGHLFLEHVCAGGGGGNVTFHGLYSSRGIPLLLISVCTSGPL